jgi:hypothetical protein
LQNGLTFGKSNSTAASAAKTFQDLQTAYTSAYCLAAAEVSLTSVNSIVAARHALQKQAAQPQPHCQSVKGNSFSVCARVF